MFNHLLVPSDGSKVAARACRAAVEFAAHRGARITGYYALEDLNVLHSGAYNGAGPIADFDRRTREAAEAHLGELARMAHAAGVAFDWKVGRVTEPHLGIVHAAQAAGCDIIFIASHGHRGLARLVLGSVTAQVIAHATMPVLVYR
jgi:nucleotide-binding universal stress UspA family protein